MNIFLSDAGVGSVSTVLWIVLLILLAVIFIEAVVMALFRLNSFGKALLHSSFVNVVSAIIGYLLINVSDSFIGKVSPLGRWLIFYGLTVLIEGLLMMLLYTRVRKGKLWLVTAIMNLASYIFLYLVSSW